MINARRSMALLLAALSLATLACSSSAPGEGAGAEAGADEAAAAPAASRGDSGRVVLTPEAEASAGIQVAPAAAAATPREGAAAAGLQVPGEVQRNPARVAVVSPRAAGRVEAMAAVEGQAVNAGAVMATLSSPDYLAAQGDLVQAVRRARALEGTADAEAAASLVTAARQRLRLLGASDARVRAIEEGAEPELLLPLAAPFAGTILERLAEPGVAAEPGTPLYRIADLSVMQVIAQVPEASLPLVRAGQTADVTVPSWGRSFPGRVARILEGMDADTRTARVVVEVPNPDRALRSGMFTSVRIAAGAQGGLGEGDATTRDAAAGAAGVSVPSAAVLTDGATRFVFVRVAPHTFQRRVVEVAEPPPGAPTTDRVMVTGGLVAGEPVVVRGAFVLRSELAKAGLADDDEG